MRFLNAVLAAAAVLGSTAKAMTPQELAAQTPTCATLCMVSLVPQSECQLTDVHCLCTNVPLNEKLAACVTKGCTIVEALAAKNLTSAFCGAPIRDSTAVPVTVGVAGGAIALVVFVLRICSALPASGRRLGWDDWTISAAMAFTVPPTIFSIFLSQNGLGKDIWTLTPKQITTVLFYYYIGELFYFAAITMTKLSILCFLLRVFPGKKFRLAVFAVMGLTIAYGIAFFLVTAFQCAPVSYSWRQLEDPLGGHCNNINLQGWTSAVFNIVLDVIVLVLPLKNLYELQMSLKKKIMIIFMFSLGIFLTIVQCVRLHGFLTFANSQNVTYDYMAVAYWSTLELDVGIICACLPSLRALFISLGAKVLASTRNSSAAQSSRAKSTLASNSTITEKQAPKKGDEGDFIPLVEVEIGTGRPDTATRKFACGPNQIRATTSVLRTSDSDDDLEQQARYAGR